MTGLVIILALAGVVEGIQEVVLGKYLKGLPMQLVAWAIGIGLCFLVQVGLFTTLGLVGPLDIIRTSGDYVFTGLLVGLGANFAHMVIGQFRPSED